MLDLNALCDTWSARKIQTALTEEKSWWRAKFEPGHASLTLPVDCHCYKRVVSQPRPDMIETSLTLNYAGHEYIISAISTEAISVHHGNPKINHLSHEKERTMATTTVYTDGSTSNNGYDGATGGIGVFFNFDDERNCCERVVENPTNNSCELLAILRAIERCGCTEGDTLRILSDSKYAIQCVTTWCHSWRKNGWQNSKGSPVKNLGTIKAILSAMETSPFSIQFEYVKAHTNGYDCDSVGNAEADRLARASHSSSSS